MTPRRPLSIRLRLLCLVLAWEAVLLAASGGVIFYHQRRLLTSTFDGGLRSNAEALAALMEYRPATETIGIDYSERVLERFARHRRPELFAAFAADGTLVESTHPLDDIPDWVQPVDDPVVRNFEYDGRDYRGIVMETKAESDDGSASIPIHVFFAAHRGPLDSRLGDSAEYTLWFAAVFLAASAAAVWWATGRGLAPIARLAALTRSIDERNLGLRFDPEGLPREIRSLADDFNGLLQRLDRAFERERRFSADAAHELRTPVASIKAGVQAAIMRERAAGRDGDGGLLVDLLAETDRLESLCESLLDVARAEEAAEVGAVHSSVLEAEIREAVSAVATREKRQVAVESSMADGNPLLRTTCTSARRIVTNLVENALRYAGPDAVVRVGFGTGFDGATVFVEDDGPGIPAEMAPRVFERFFRADKHRARLRGGAGLGLSICRALATAEGGDLRHESVEPQGCRIVWRIAAGPRDG